MTTLKNAAHPAPFDDEPGAEKGRLFIISAPSGAGKTTLCHKLLDHFYEMLYSISYTTRPPRENERDGVDYHFVSTAEFQKGIRDGAWAEWAEVHDNFYGTSAKFIDASLSEGKDVLLDIDVRGAFQILERYPESETIFIMPPSLEELRRRLETRGSDSPAVIERRLENAKKEMAERGRYRNVVVNDDLNEALTELMEIIDRGL
ncbi:MAG: guanylate kinase [Desulfobacterales bacterium]|nr:guanylate kinase [Desulfobacterales bacterium]